MRVGYSETVNCLKKKSEYYNRETLVNLLTYHDRSFFSPSILTKSMSGIVSRIRLTVKHACVRVAQKAQFAE